MVALLVAERPDRREDAAWAGVAKPRPAKAITRATSAETTCRKARVRCWCDIGGLLGLVQLVRRTLAAAGRTVGVATRQPSRAARGRRAGRPTQFRAGR